MLRGIKDSSDVIFRKLSDGKVDFFLNYANSFSVDFKSGQKDLLAKGVKRLSFADAKEGSIKISTELLDEKVVAMLLGATIFQGAADISEREALTSDATTSVTLTETPKSGSVSAFLLDIDGLGHKTEIAISTTETNPSAGTAYLNGKVLKFNVADAPEGTKVVVYYLTDKATGMKKFTVNATEEAKYYSLTCFTSVRRDYDGQDVPVELRFPKVVPSSNISFQFNASDVSKFDLELTVLGDVNGDMMTWIEQSI